MDNTAPVFRPSAASAPARAAGDAPAPRQVLRLKRSRREIAHETLVCDISISAAAGAGAVVGPTNKRPAPASVNASISAAAADAVAGVASVGTRAASVLEHHLSRVTLSPSSQPGPDAASSSSNPNPAPTNANGRASAIAIAHSEMDPRIAAALAMSHTPLAGLPSDGLASLPAELETPFSSLPAAAEFVSKLSGRGNADTELQQQHETGQLQRQQG